MLRLRPLFIIGPGKILKPRPLGAVAARSARRLGKIFCRGIGRLSRPQPPPRGGTTTLRGGVARGGADERALGVKWQSHLT